MVKINLRSDADKTVREVIVGRIRGAKTWLLEQQRPDGSWKGSPWHTAKIIIGLIKTGVDPDNTQILDAYKWLLKVRQTADTGLNWEGWTWDTALVVRAMSQIKAQGANEYIEMGLKWAKGEEKKSLESPVEATYFGRCYTAQVLLAMIEAEDSDSQSKNLFISTLQTQQERDGGWINSFDTAQIIEALLAANSQRIWRVKPNLGGAYDGGFDQAVAWIENAQSRFGNWDGTTWPTALLFRAYLLSARSYDPAVVNLALNWLLAQKAAHNESWFHEQARTASAMITLNIVLDVFNGKNSDVLDLEKREHNWRALYATFLGQKKVQQRTFVDRNQFEEAINSKDIELKKARNQLKLYSVFLGSFLVIAAIVSFVLNYDLASAVFTILGIVLAFLSFRPTP